MSVDTLSRSITIRAYVPMSTGHFIFDGEAPRFVEHAHGWGEEFNRLLVSPDYLPEVFSSVCPEDELLKELPGWKRDADWIIPYKFEWPLALTSTGEEWIIEAADAVEALHNRFVRALLVLSLSRPGQHSSYSGKIRFDNYVAPIDAACSFLSPACEYAKLLGWPAIQTLDPKIVHDWLSRFLEYERGQSSTPLGRALAAFSQLAHRSEGNVYSPLDIFWTMLALEAIYCDRKDGLQEQLSTRIQLMLGEPPRNKKLLKKLYNYRSQLIHGSLDLPFVGAEWHASETFHVEAQNSVSYSLAILIATLQKFIIEDKTSVSFTELATLN